MATINIGNIKLNWKGAYNSSTAYVVDDVVSHNGSSYVCILASTGNAPTNTTYWEQMSAKGVDADLINITGTVQGDLYYNNGSAIARLGAGTSGQLLQTGGASANPSWTDAPVGGAISTHITHLNGSHNTTSTSYQTIGSGMSLTFTPASTTSKILLLGSLTTYGNYGHYTFFRGSTNLATDAMSATERMGHISPSSWVHTHISYLDVPNTSSSVTYEIKMKTSNSSNHVYVGDGNLILNTFTAIEL